MTDEQRVYVVTMTAVYDHGTIGVFSTWQAAQAHALAHMDDSDRHHTYRIDEVVIDVPVWLTNRGSHLTPHNYNIDHVVEFVGWNPVYADRSRTPMGRSAFNGPVPAAPGPPDLP